MKSKGWRLAQSYQWVKERRHSVELTPGVYQQLQEYEQKIYGAIDSSSSLLPGFSPTVLPSISFGFPKINDPAQLPSFSTAGTPSLFARPTLDIAPTEFTFGAGPMQKNVAGSPFSANQTNPNATDVQMDGS
ncbi:dual specificity phosphatase [Vigna unguiculata]|nr:dual specificity phosphatase [Vigna unguiculata]